jgi:hypothetical protein
MNDAVGACRRSQVGDTEQVMRPPRGQAVVMRVSGRRAAVISFLSLLLLAACAGGGGTVASSAGGSLPVTIPTPTSQQSASPTAQPTSAPTSQPPPAGAPTVAGCRIFPPDNPWNTDVSGAPVDANSARILRA